ncbi:MAG: ACT domain-containing protein [Acidobacteria bacterium]|nr:MAG: ACT domain-containing protein [Acidobacteriota bacterium]MCL4287816.1 ACT domain-containing protein [Thermoleophilia bacterium]
MLEGELAVIRLGTGDAVPEWARPGAGGLLSTTVTAAETSIVCRADDVPADACVSRGWRALAVAGPLDHALTGVLASIAAPLAEADVPVFAVSTFDTDYILVPVDRAGAAADALRGAGHRLRGLGPTER